MRIFPKTQEVKILKKIFDLSPLAACVFHPGNLEDSKFFFGREMTLCDGGTPTSKHKKANQLTQTFSHCLRCT